MQVERGERSIATQRAPAAYEAAAYKKITASLVPNHTKPPNAKFALTADAAIEAVIAVEQANPKLIPAGFRAEILAKPRDAALRWRLGECELKLPTTRRRASYDLAMALLLGEDAATLQRPLDEATRNERADNNQMRTCNGDDCGSGEVCWRGECTTQMGMAVLAINAAELQIETALSRALYPRFLQQHGAYVDDRDPVFWFLTRRLHACGRAVCTFSQYSSKSGLALVEWDRRDGGAALRRDKLPARIEKCANATGFDTLAPCLQDCAERNQPNACFRSCIDNCGAR